MLLSAATRATITVLRRGRRASGSLVPFRVVTVRMATTKVATVIVFRVEDRNLSSLKRDHSREIIGSVADDFDHVCDVEGTRHAFDCHALRHRRADSMTSCEHVIGCGVDRASAFARSCAHDEMVDGWHGHVRVLGVQHLFGGVHALAHALNGGDHQRAPDLGRILSPSANARMKIKVSVSIQMNRIDSVQCRRQPNRRRQRMQTGRRSR